MPTIFEPSSINAVPCTSKCLTELFNLFLSGNPMNQVLYIISTLQTSFLGTEC